MDVEGGARDLWLGLFLLASLAAMCVFTFVGVWVVARWVWRIA